MKSTLEVIPAPPLGYTPFLNDVSCLGQAICFIRPVQKNLSLDAKETDGNEEVRTTL